MTTESPDELRIGVDLGGTKIEAVVVRLADGAPEVLARLRVPTERELGYDHILDAVAGIIRKVATEAGLRELPPIGVGMPGSVTRARRTIKNSNTTCLNGRPFREDLIARMGSGARAGIEFANDANCFALAEARFGAGRGAELVFGVILGTGVGGGIVLCDRPGEPPRIWDGRQGIAGEWGHVTLDPVSGPPCYCGRRGCIETYLCGPALEAAYQARTGVHRPLRELAKSAETDAAAAATLDSAVVTFGRALATVINILDPDVVVLGGGVSNINIFYDRGPTEVARWIFSDELTTRIVRHELGDSAGVIGAALLHRGPGSAALP